MIYFKIFTAILMFVTLFLGYINKQLITKILSLIITLNYILVAFITKDYWNFCWASIWLIGFLKIQFPYKNK
jgi:hypothetical protein